MDVLDLLNNIDENEEIHLNIGCLRHRGNAFEEYDNVTFKSRYKLLKNGARTLLNSFKRPWSIQVEITLFNQLSRENIIRRLIARLLIRDVRNVEERAECFKQNTRSV
uniref:Uncharacterized protein n=1 Tax=Romanomermis culicivorax TaxID=13658 RepID=A0A915J188_ROMCU